MSHLYRSTVHIIPESSPRKLFSVLEVMLKLAIARGQWAPPKQFCSVKNSVFVSSIASGLLDQSKCSFSYSRLNEERSRYRAVKSLCSCKQQKGYIKEKMILPRMTNKHYLGCLGSASQPQDEESVLWISTFPAPSTQDANAFTSYFHLLCSLSMLQPLWAGEAVHSNRCSNLVKGKLALHTPGADVVMRVACTFEVHSQDDLV